MVEADDIAAVAAYETHEAKDMSAAIAIFVKTPGLSPVKTRLAAGIGVEKAEEFYVLSLKAVEAVVKAVDAKVFWAVGEEEGLDDPLWSGLEALYTGEGGLGERQYHIYSTLLEQHERVILIGADAPQLSPTLLEEAVSALDAHDFVIGPARDGGYYLFGGKAPVSKDIWSSVEYSCDTTRENLIKALPATPASLAMLTDVDTQDDLSYCIREMSEDIVKEQKNTVKWIEINLLANTARATA